MKISHNHNQYMLEYNIRKPQQYLLRAAKHRAKMRNMKFNISCEDIIIPAYCPILGIQLHRGVGSGCKPNSPSIDRINPKKGYVKGNVRVISGKANRMKADGNNDELITFAKAMLRDLT